MFGNESKSTNVREIAHLMKSGSADEINAYFNKMKKEQVQEEDFYTFFNRKIDESPYKRAEVAQRAGMSKDYTYKILRGDKKTTERDYILALCLAMSLDLFDTQRALELYPFPALNEEDPRGAIIVAGVIYKVGVDTLNEWLEKAGLPMIKTSPDMPSAEVGPVRSTLFSENLLHSLSERTKQLKSERRSAMEKIREEVRVERCGMGPMDLAFIGEIEVDTGKKTVYVCAYYGMETVLYVSENSIMSSNEMIDEGNVLESYADITDAAGSDYFPYFLELDKLTDEKAEQTKRQMNDSKYYSGIRMGQTVGLDFGTHAELFNDLQPEYKEYYQVVRKDGIFHYSMSHESVYMRNELGKFYDAYYPGTEEPKYLFEVTDIEDVPEKYGFAKHTFKHMRAAIGDFLQKNLGYSLPEAEMEYPQFMICGFKNLRVNVLRNSGPTGKETQYVAEITSKAGKNTDTPRYITYIRSDGMEFWCVNTMSFYDAYFVDQSIRAGMGIQEKNTSIDELKRSGYRDVFLKLKEAVDSYSGDGEYVWTLDEEDDPFELSGMIGN